MYISVIIPTYKRNKDLKITLDSLSNQKILPNETIIVDQSPGQDTENLCKQKKYKSIWIRYFYRSDPSSARARNQWIEKLNEKSEIVLFFDDDVEIDKNYTLEVINFFKKYPDALWGGSKITNLSFSRIFEFFWPPFIRETFSSVSAQLKNKDKIQNINSAMSCTMFLRKNILDKGYKFPEWMDKYWWDDLFISYSINRDYPKSLFYLPTAEINHFLSPYWKILPESHFKQRIVHDFIFFNIFNLPLRKFYWLSVWPFLLYIKRYFNKIKTIKLFFKIHYRLMKNRKKIKESPSIINNFIFDN